ncbi:MAG: preprotein translocase subunit SecG [Thermoanaerobaculia bacterium]|nr:preprotein translocase subunit SecG [Thermoanaerobaculia bacterium]
MITFLYIVHILVSIFLVLVILLQQGSGADLSVFGGGSTQAAFGARGATQLIHKLTVWGFVAFILLTLAIAVLQGGREGSVVTGIEEEPVGVEQTVEPEASEETEYVAEELEPEQGEGATGEDGGSGED